MSYLFQKPALESSVSSITSCMKISSTEARTRSYPLSTSRKQREEKEYEHFYLRRRLVTRSRGAQLVWRPQRYMCAQSSCTKGIISSRLWETLEKSSSNST